MADRHEGLGELAFQVRQRHDSFGVVEHRREVTHLGEGDQPLVTCVLAGHRVEQVHVLDRRQPVDLEVLQAPQVVALAEHGVQPAEAAVLDEGAAVDTVGHVVRRAAVGVGRQHRDVDAPRRSVDELGSLQVATNRGLGCVLTPGRAVATDEELDDRLRASLERSDIERGCAGEVGELVEHAVEPDEADPCSLVVVLRGDRRSAVQRRPLDSREVPDPIEASQQHLEQQLGQPRVVATGPSDEQRPERLRARHELVQQLRTTTRRRVGGELVHQFAHVRPHLGAGRVEDGFVHGDEAQLPCEVRHGVRPVLGVADQPVEHST